jgi:hypothetical protein
MFVGISGQITICHTNNSFSINLTDKRRLLLKWISSRNLNQDKLFYPSFNITNAVNIVYQNPASLLHYKEEICNTTQCWRQHFYILILQLYFNLNNLLVTLYIYQLLYDTNVYTFTIYWKVKIICCLYLYNIIVLWRW